MNGPDDEREWAVIRVVCPSCGRLFYRKVQANCNLCGLFLKGRTAIDWPYIVVFLGTLAVGMTAAWACKFF